MEHEDAFDLLTLVGLRLSAATTRGCHAMGLTETEARVIACLAINGASRPGIVGQTIGTSKRRMTQLVDSLSTKGHIIRGIDHGDARARILRLTPSGQRLARRIARLRTAWAEDLLESLPAADLQVLASTLAVILKRLDA